jgi:Flp pilus assembly protein TadD
MLHFRAIRRAALLGLTLLSACGAADPTSGSPTLGSPASGSPSGAAVHSRQSTLSGVYGAFLDGEFAISQSDQSEAAAQFLRALAGDPNNPELLQQAFIACVLSGRSEATQLARQLPDNQAAQLLLGDNDARSGDWDAAEARFRGLPRQGVTQLLQPLLVAWVQQGSGRTDTALGTLRPYLDGQRFRGAYALHAALIADLGGHDADAAKLYRAAQSEFPGVDLRLAQILASWQSRQNHQAEALRIMAGLTDTSPEMAIALPGLVAHLQQRPVSKATDGIAEAYLALAGALRDQDASDFAMLLLRLALELRPDFTPARLLAADILQTQKHNELALQMLTPVAADDPLSPVVRLHRATLTEQLGQSVEAMAALRQIAQEYPDSPLPLLQEGDLLRMKQRFPEAISAYSSALERIKSPGRNDWPIFYDRGVAYERTHQWPKAEADFRHALDLAPDQPLVLNYLGYSWADAGVHLTDARKMIEAAAQQRPNDGAITDSLGWVMLRQGDSSGAVRTLERAVELEPDDATINGHLGDAYWAAGRKLEATYQWQRALALNPEPDDVAKLEAKLKTGASPSVVSGQ